MCQRRQHELQLDNQHRRRQRHMSHRFDLLSFPMQNQLRHRRQNLQSQTLSH